MSKMIAAASTRVDVVFIRKSTKAQDEQGQIDNVQAMLRDVGVFVAERYWYAGTVGRRKVRANAEFNSLMEMVEAGKVRTVYVESQDRWGTGDRTELFSLLGTLRQNGTKLYDLRAGKDLTEKDLANELLAIVNSIKSEKELEDISYRSLRTRVNNFKDNGSWPTGTHPFGYGKACHAADGKLLWTWQPVSRSRGQLFSPTSNGCLTPGPVNVPIPRKNKGDRITLVPSNNPDVVQAVRLAFELYAKVGVSRRQVSARLNGQGLRFYGREWSHSQVTHVLRNPAYVGDTHFGKTRTGELHTFDDKGLIIKVQKGQEPKQRNAAERIIRHGTHEALVDRTLWEQTQARLEGELAAARVDNKRFSPRNPAYYLKQLFVCGHCGKGMVGRTETDPTSRKRTVVYVCATYVRGRCGGHQVGCGYHRINHDEAERLLLDKVRELGLRYDETASQAARANLRERLSRLGHEDSEAVQQWEDWVEEGIKAFVRYLVDEHGLRYGDLTYVSDLGIDHYACGEDNRNVRLDRFAAGLTDLRAAVMEAEAAVVETARSKVGELTQEHKVLTLAWARASELQKGVLQAELERLEGDIREWKPRTVPLTERLHTLYTAEAGREAERRELVTEWPTLQAREKGEGLRRLFQSVTLFWERRYHPTLTKPNRPKKTARAGRFSYHLKLDRIGWAYAASDLGGSW